MSENTRGASPALKSTHLKNALYGWLSNATAIAICSPLEVIRTQLQVTGRDKNHSLWHLTKDVMRKQSISGFYKGLGASIVTQPSFWLIYMPTYEYLKNEYTDAPKFVTSSIAGGIGTLFTNPLWVMRARMQTEVLRGDRVYYTTFFQKTIKEEGVASLWKGGAVALFKNLQMGIQLPLYEYLREEKGVNAFWSGILSKMVSSTIVYPLDVIRTNLRAEIGHISLKNMTTRIYQRNGGILNFYRGIPIYYFSQLPTFAVTMVVFEKLRNKT